MHRCFFTCSHLQSDSFLENYLLMYLTLNIFTYTFSFASSVNILLFHDIFGSFLIWRFSWNCSVLHFFSFNNAYLSFAFFIMKWWNAISITAMGITHIITSNCLQKIYRLSIGKRYFCFSFWIKKKDYLFELRWTPFNSNELYCMTLVFQIRPLYQILKTCSRKKRKQVKIV